MKTARLTSFLVAFGLAALGGCDQLGIESATQIAAQKQAEGKAIGAACRHAARAIEDCYTLNKKADKAAMFEGWREMDNYMRENKLEPVAPQVPTTKLRPPAAEGEPPQDDGPAAEEGAAKTETAGSGGH